MKNTLFALLVWGTIMASGLITVNLQHNLHLPKEILNRNTITSNYSFSIDYPFITKVVDIYMVDEIRSYKQTQDIVEALNSASSNTVVNMHLAGYGGDIEPVDRIINSMLTSKANVVTIVEAPVYSGHAYIAIYGKTLVIRPYAYIMLHTTSIWGHDCSDEEGMDRGITKRKSCENFMYNHMYLTTRIIMEAPILTSDQKQDLLLGREVYIQSDAAQLIEGGK